MVIDSLDNQIEEVLNKQLFVAYPDMSPFFKMMVTSEGVKRDGWGADWKIRKVLQSGLTGVVEMDTPWVTEGSSTNDLTNNQFYEYGTQDTFPNPLDSFNPMPYRMEITLKGLKFTLPVTFAELNLDALPATIGEIWGEKLAGFARQVAHYRINSFFSMDTQGQLCTATIADISAAETYSSPNGSITFTTTEKVINRFERGQQVDFYTDSSGAPSAQINYLTSDGRINCVVTAVNRIRNTVRVQYRRATGSPTITNGIFQDNLSGSGGTAAFSDGDTMHVFLRAQLADQAYTAGDEDRFSGLNTFLRDPSAAGDPGGTLFGMNLTDYPEWTSLVLDNASAALTEQDLALAITKFNSARRPFGQTVDTAVTTPGVYNAFMANRIGRERIDRTSGLRSAGNMGNTQEFQVVVNGTNVTIMLDDYVQSGHMYVIKRSGNNFKRYLPPLPAGSDGAGPGGFSAVEEFREFEFAGKMAGYPSARVPVRDTTNNRLTQMVEYPGYSRMEIVPDQFAGIKWTGLAEDTISVA